MRRVPRVLFLFVALATLVAVAASGSSAVDGAELETSARDEAIPAGAVMFFDLDQCPQGWAGFREARGRVIVGGPPGVMVGSPLLSGETPEHRHFWMEYRVNDWYTFDQSGDLALMMEWHDGTTTEGAGFYGLGHWGAVTGSEFFYTEEVDGNLPYIQLRPCIKS